MEQKSRTNELMGGNNRFGYVPVSRKKARKIWLRNQQIDKEKKEMQKGKSRAFISLFLISLNN